MKDRRSAETQALLAEIRAEQAADAQAALTCSNGEPWMGPHPICEAETARHCAEFDAAVARGEYDAEGYTPNERKAQAKRQQSGETQ